MGDEERAVHEVFKDWQDLQETCDENVKMEVVRKHFHLPSTFFNHGCLSFNVCFCKNKFFLQHCFCFCNIVFVSALLVLLYFLFTFYRFLPFRFHSLQMVILGFLTHTLTNISVQKKSIIKKIFQMILKFNLKKSLKKTSLTNNFENQPSTHCR